MINDTLQDKRIDLTFSNIYVTFLIEIAEYLNKDGQSPFAKWFDDLDVRAALKVNTYITRIGQGNFSRVEGV